MRPQTTSAAEERFEHWRRTVGLFAGPAALLLVWFSPIEGLSTVAHRLAGIVALVVTWWVTEAIPIPATALIGSALTVVCGVATAPEALTPFASPTIFLFMGSFMIGEAISTHQLDRRMVSALLSLRLVGGNLGRMRLAIAGLTFVLSAWMSNTATTAMMLPIVMGILTTGRASEEARDRSFQTGLLLTLAYVASIGGIVTPVGTPPNLITLGLLRDVAGVRINFLLWIALVAPIAVALWLVLLAIVNRRFPVRIPPAAIASALVPPSRSQGWSRGQWNCVVAFGMAVLLWITPGLLALTTGGDEDWVRTLGARLDEGVVAVLAAGVLFVLPTDWSARQFTLTWQAASRIDWGTILLFGGGLSLGHLMFSTGLASYVGTGLVSASGAESLWTVTAVSIAIAIVLTEITSNTAATNMLVPVVLSICEVSGLNPVPPAIGVCLGASFAFMLPISTPPNAVVYGTGLVPVMSMIRFGFVLDVVGFVIVLVGLRILCPLLGFA